MPQAMLLLVFSKDLLGGKLFGGKLFRDSGRMRSWTQLNSNLKEMFNDMPLSNQPGRLLGSTQKGQIPTIPLSTKKCAVQIPQT